MHLNQMLTMTSKVRYRALRIIPETEYSADPTKNDLHHWELLILKSDWIRASATGLLVSTSLLLTTLWLAWHILTSANFGYELGYKLLHIDQHIQKYGPQNIYKKGFETTNAEQHTQLFNAILVSVNNEGRGLNNIFYQPHSGAQIQLLRAPEITHLEDVARLLSLFKWTAMMGTCCWILLLAYHYKRKRALPDLPSTLTGLGMLLISSVSLTFLIGPKTVFYWLHIHIFPPEHQWFFYYQESLMTTLMKAPDLFGFFAAIWGTLALILFFVLETISRQLIRKRLSNSAQ